MAEYQLKYPPGSRGAPKGEVHRATERHPRQLPTVHLPSRERGALPPPLLPHLALQTHLHRGGDCRSPITSLATPLNLANRHQLLRPGLLPLLRCGSALLRDVCELDLLAHHWICRTRYSEAECWYSGIHSPKHPRDQIGYHRQVLL